MINSEVHLYFCINHMDTDTSLTHPGYAFSWFPIYTPRKCAFDGCSTKAYNMLIGLKVPETSNISCVESGIAAKETFLEAKEAMQGGPAIDKLTSYLYFKIRMFSYETGDFMAFTLLKKYAKLVLKMLKIEESADLNDKDIKRILNKLDLLPEGH